MGIRQLYMRAWAWLLIMLLAVPPEIVAQQTDNGAVFKPEELEQILAPIALHPDSLISQILMASTYPFEVVAGGTVGKAKCQSQGGCAGQGP
jgi:hypothetical protein